jgi:methylglyoxal synthase
MMPYKKIALVAYDKLESGPPGGDRQIGAKM